ncbi:MAG TPA: VOC family protein [Bryobacteraceae bacterium]|nr:VOC family protein [Bryobacteraceae bacterium]
MFHSTNVDHLVFRVSDTKQTERFYNALLGAPLFRAEDYVMYMVGETRLFFTPSSGQAAAHNKENIGFNHMALGLRTLEELQTVESQLNEAGIAHSGIRVWEDGLTKYIWLDDPDGMRIEYWLRLPEEP